MKKTKPGTVTSMTIIGNRSDQEDRIFYKRITGKGYSGWLIAVMDGHNGADTAEFCKQHIPQHFKLKSAATVKEALRNLIVELDEASKDFTSGAVISVACILESHDEVSVAVLGDAPVLVLDHKNKLHRSPEHNVRTNVAEKTAVESRGGYCIGGYVYNTAGGSGLQLTRALGNSHMGSIISREPEIYTVRSLRWLAVASDGIIDPGHSSKSLPRGFISVCRKKVDAEQLIEKWVCYAGRRPSDNTSIVVWKKA